MPWQEEWLILALVHDKAGLPLYDVASILSIPRQSGKTTVVRVLIGWWAVRFPGSWSVFVAQTRGMAAQHVKGLGRDLIRAGVPCRVYAGIPEHIDFENGSAIHVAAPNHTSLHGATITGVAVIDEGWISLSAEVLQSIVPARAAAPRSLLVMLSTMGTTDSEDWMSFVERGREGEPGISYTEFSMDVDTQDLFAEDQWQLWMPALGHTQTTRTIRAGMSLLSPGEARRAYGNIPTSTLHDLFDMEKWTDQEDIYQEPVTGEVVLGITVTAHNPRGSCVTAAWLREDERWHVEVVEHRPGGGVFWILNELEQLITDWKPRAISIGATSAVYAIKPEIEKICADYTVPFSRLSAGDEKAAASLWSEMLRDNRLTHGQAETLDLAIQYAIPKGMDEAGYRIDSRNMKVDSSPLTSAIAALSIGIEEASTRVVGGIF